MEQCDVSKTFLSSAVGTLRCKLEAGHEGVHESNYIDTWGLQGITWTVDPCGNETLYLTPERVVRPIHCFLYKGHTGEHQGRTTASAIYGLLFWPDNNLDATVQGALTVSPLSIENIASLPTDLTLE